MDILIMILVVLIIGFVVLFMISLLWAMCVEPIIKHKINKETNKIQWMCRETNDSIAAHQTLKTKGADCDLYYRVIPSELSKFVNIFDYNDWKSVKYFENIHFNNKEEFVDFVKDFQTVKDIKDFKEGKQGVLWYHP